LIGVVVIDVIAEKEKYVVLKCIWQGKTKRMGKVLVFGKENRREKKI